MRIQNIGFIGLGLIGGSLAKTIRRVYPDIKLMGYNRSKASLVAAMEDGTLNEAYDEIGDAFGRCDMIFLCAPVGVNIDCLKKLKGIIRSDCLLTDVGSVKNTIHEAVEALGLSAQFIGGHPMAGSERFGYQNAADHLLENAWYVLTPSEKSSEQMLKEYRELVEEIGSLPVILPPKEHDRVTAAISHLPHVIAYALVNQVERTDSPEEMMRQLAAGGFKDLTRIASSSPDMWQQICEENREALAEALALYRENLKQMEEAIREGNGPWLRREFDAARIYRENLPQVPKGSLPGVSPISVDLEDEPGAIAVVLTILGGAWINIQNVEIVYNRESQDGVLKIYLADDETAAKAKELLIRRNYRVYP